MSSQDDRDQFSIVDNGGLAPARHFCPHIVNGIQFPTNSSHFPNLSNKKMIHCSVNKCNDHKSNESWLCLSCFSIFCGRYSNKHMIQHKDNDEYNDHCIALGIGDLSFWCYKCDDYLDHLSIEKVFELYQIVHQSKFNEAIPNLSKLKLKCNFKQQQLFMKYLNIPTNDDHKDNEEQKQNDNINSNHAKTRNPLANPLNKRRFGTSGASTALSDEKTKEYFDSTQVMKSKAIQCAKIINNSTHITVYTGAGISTAANIPDYRGPNGIWTLQSKGITKRNSKSVALENAIPTYCHLALVQLLKNGMIHHIVSTNVDGLHIRSGVKQENISELHGNIYIEFCNKCGTEYKRPFKVKGELMRRNKKRRNVSRRFTGRLCDNINCTGKLRDSIIGFGENLAENEFITSIQNSIKSDVVIVIGSSMSVTPANDLPSLSYFKNGTFILINLQKTNYDRFADVRVFQKCDAFMKLLCKELKIDDKIKAFDKETEMKILNERKHKIQKLLRIDPDY